MRLWNNILQIRYDHNRQIVNTNNLKVFGSKKTNGFKQDGLNRMV
jgi:hypothetical protein